MGQAFRSDRPARLPLTTHHSHWPFSPNIHVVADFAAGDTAGADAYMVKPFSPAKLVEVVEMREKLAKPVRAYGY